MPTAPVRNAGSACARAAPGMTNSSRPLCYNTGMQVIYLDSLFCTSLLTDYLLCLTAGRLCGLRLRRGRYLAAGLLGAVYAVAVFLPGCAFLSLPAGRLGAGVCMGLLAFARERQPLRCTAVLLLTAAAFGGALWAVSLAFGGDLSAGAAPLSLPVLGLSFGICYALLSLLLRARRLLTERRRVEVTVRFLEREAAFLALEDTGNSLTDPVTGRPVLVASPRALRPLLRGAAPLFAALPPVELLEALSTVPELKGRFRLLPYSNLSGSGLLPVFRQDALLLDGEPDADLLIAVSPNAVGVGFEALL